MTERSIDELGPVDYLIVEFPAGAQNLTGEGAEELLRLHDAGIIWVMDLLILQKAEDGTVMAQELGDLDDLGELARLEAELVQTLAEEDVDKLAAAMDPEHRRCPHLREPVGRAIRLCDATGGRSAHRQLGGSRSRPSSPPSRLTRRSNHKESDMPLGPGRAGRGVIGAPVAKAAVVGAAVGPGRSPVATAAVVGADCRARPVTRREGGRRRRRGDAWSASLQPDLDSPRDLTWPPVLAVASDTGPGSLLGSRIGYTPTYPGCARALRSAGPRPAHDRPRPLRQPSSTGGA